MGHPAYEITQINTFDQTAQPSECAVGSVANHDKAHVVVTVIVFAVSLYF
jgi:hypothetical protein